MSVCICGGASQLRDGPARHPPLMSMAEPKETHEVEEQAALYAMGASSPEEAARFRARIASGCALCIAELQACQDALAALAFSAGEVSPPLSARSRLMKRIAEEARSQTALTGILVRGDESEWSPSPVPGVHIRKLYREKTMLVRMAPRTWYPAHDHPDAEQCLVLEGSITTEGVTAYAGDFTYLPAGSSHAPLYSEAGCVLLIAYT